MSRQTIALFGEAEKGSFYTAYYCESLPQLLDIFGNPPPDSRGLHLAVQALLFNRQLLFFRVKEEGFSTQHYYYGLHCLESKQLCQELTALCLPGVGNHEIIEATTPICSHYRSMLVLSERDLYDYLTTAKA